MRKLITGLLLSLIFLPNIFSQFGQNKVQYKVFKWSFIQSKHFDIYFSQDGEYTSQFTASVAESSLASLNRNIGYDIKNRIPIIIYNSHNEFQQNNIIDEYLPEGVGGVTELFKNRIVIPFEGDYAKFRHVIHHELLHAYMNDMYYGGSIQNIITKNIQLQFPIWFSEGMAEYQSLNGNDKDNDMFMRDAVMYDYLPPVDYLGGYLAYRGGQAFFAWLAEEYGQEKIGDLMRQIKAIGDVDESFNDVYKFTIEELSEKFIKAMKQTYWPDIKSRQEVTDFAKRITDAKKGDGYYNTAPAISPDGKTIAYLSNRNEYFSLYLTDIKTGRTQELIEGNTTANFEELHLLSPGLCWSPNGKYLVFSVKSGSKDAIYIIDIKEEDEYEIPTKFDGVFSASWNPKKDLIVFRADNSKQSDLWLYDVKKKKLTRITDDAFSDLDPTWSADGEKIYFTSDRGNNLELSSNIRMADYDYSQKDLYVYDMNENKISRFMENKNTEETSVVSSPDGKKILYLSDKNGIKNIWLKDLETNVERPITNTISPINFISLTKDGKRLAFSSLHKGAYDLFYIENPFEIDLKLSDLPPTDFVLKQMKLDSNLTNLTKIEIKDSNLVKNDSMVTVDSSSVYGNNISLNLNNEVRTDTSVTGTKKKENKKFQISDNTNNDGSFKINRYKIKFSPDIIYSNANYSSFYGVQGVAQMQFSDILGNHRVYLATSLVLDLKNSDYALAYYYLPKRIDYGIEVFHSARFLLIDKGNNFSELHRYRTYGGNLSLSYPISKFNRLDGAVSLTRLTKENLDNPLEPSQNLNTVVPFISYVHDNTIFGYTAPIRGTRYNLTLLGTPKLGSNGVSFASAILDYRAYINLFEDYGFVWRFNAGYSFGKNPQKFYLGGTENWINYEIDNNRVPIEDINDFAFASPVYPLRGYNYNSVSGSKFALMNAEFRFPFLRYLIFGALPLAFQNIQGVLFTDVGTAWNDNKSLKLFRKEGTDIVTNDLLIGMGTGLRVFLLYFPMKFDVAWSYDLRKFSKPRYYISLGADF